MALGAEMNRIAARSVFFLALPLPLALGALHVIEREPKLTASYSALCALCARVCLSAAIGFES